jgi:L-2-hydroxyglutarate oxidase
MDDLIPGGAGVRAQACTRDGRLIDDFLIVEDKGVINILNAPSPAATASLAIGEAISQNVIHHL